MLSGLQVAGSIDSAMQQARREAAVVDREVAHLTDRLLQLTEEQGALYQTLARLRLDAARSGHLLEKLSLADRRARELCEHRAAKLAELDRELTAATAALTTLREQHSAILQDAETLARAAAAAERALRAEWEHDPDYRQRRAALEATQATARLASQKTELAEKDRLVKGRPYEDDPLFRYLWERRFGTAEYRGNFLTRPIDAWVARHTGYTRAALNYRMLSEIPKRLAEHAERLRAAVENDRERLRQFEEAALNGGESGTRRAALRQARDRLEQAEDRLEAAEREASRLLEVKNTLARGDDPETQEILRALEATLRTSDLRELREAALGTPTREDDAVVQRLLGIETERKRVESALDNQKQIQASQQRRLAELEAVKREYRRGGYRNDSWDFGSPEMLSVLLGEMLRGATSRDVFWETMRRHQRPLPTDSGGTAGDWPGTAGDSPSGPDDSFGGGGFRTGGGF